MRAIVITNPGRIDSLEVREVPAPVQTDDQVRVRIRACGLNRADLLQAAGHYPAPPGFPPEIPGLEFAGEVEAVGSGPRSRFRPGDRVFGITGGGAFADLVVSPEGMLVRIPDGLDFEEAAAVP